MLPLLLLPYKVSSRYYTPVLHPFIPNSPGALTYPWRKSSFPVKETFKLPPTTEEHCKGVFIKFPYKPQDKDGACLKMAAVDMAREEAATQLFTEKNRTITGSSTLEPVGRLFYWVVFVNVWGKGRPPHTCQQERLMWSCFRFSPVPQWCWSQITDTSVLKN